VYAVAGTGASYIAGQRAAPTMHCELSLEERFQLRRLALELLPCSREQLIRQVLEEREDALLQGRFYRQALEAMGCELVEEADVELVLPQSEAELMEVFGRRPSDQELADYCNQKILEHQEAARMDVDIEAIALESEEPG
jgi:hypothetical protein